jgi:nucleotide-binding universal stress UspA family protein
LIQRNGGLAIQVESAALTRWIVHRQKEQKAAAMPFKTLLTVTGPLFNDGDLRVAATLCEQIDAHLSVLTLALAAPPPVGEYAAMVSDVWLEQRQADLKELKQRNVAVSDFLSAQAVSSDLSTEYKDIAWADEAIGRRARHADLTVLGPEMLGHEALKDKTIEGALFSSGRPMLVVPAGTHPTLKPRKVMIAWDGRLEAARAVREAIEVLVAADEVRVVLVDPKANERDHGAEPGADVAAYLARHGVKVTVDRLPSQGMTVAEVLRRHAGDTAAELLVMGAYGHSRLRERIFGGTTRSMLEETTVPVFMAR